MPPEDAVVYWKLVPEDAVLTVHCASTWPPVVAAAKFPSVTRLLVLLHIVTGPPAISRGY